VTVHPSALWMTPSGNPVVLEANTQYTFTGQGGTPPYHYTRSGTVGSIGYWTGIFISDTACTTTVTVTDSASVSVNTLVNVNQPVSPLEITPTSAVVETGTQLDFDASGGQSPYTFTKLTGVGSIDQSTGLYSAGGTAGSAVVQVEDSGTTSTTATASITVNNPPPPLAITPSSATVDIGGTQPFMASGGTPPYVFTSIGAGSINSSTGLYTGTTLGSALVTVADSKSRTASAPVTVQKELGITPSSTSIVVTGTVMLVASGGSESYSSWVVVEGGAGGTVPGDASGPTVTYTAPAGVGGIYTDTVRLTDSESNTADCTITVTPEELTLSPSTITLQVGNSVTFVADGGEPYTFSVASGVGSINEISGLYGAGPVEGTAVVQVLDNYGRTRTASVTVNPPPLELSPASITIQAGGSVTFAAAGGTAPYTFSKVTGVGSIGASDGVYTSAVEGTATVKVTDSMARTDTAAVTVDPPPAPPLNLSPVNVNVQTGAQQIFIPDGGTQPYSWSVLEDPLGGTITTSGVYTAPASVTTSPTAYHVRLTDSMSLIRTATVNVYAPLEITPHLTAVEAVKQADFDASGGIFPYAFSVTSGVGTIDAATGLFTASGFTGPTKIRVTDAQGLFTEWSFDVSDPASWAAKQPIEAAKKSGQYASLAVTPDGVPIIAYWQASDKDLKVAVGPSWMLVAVDRNYGGDQYASLALDGDGHSRIAWYDAGHQELKYREWNGMWWNDAVTVDTNGTVGQYASLALDGSGNPRIAYYDASNGNLKYAAWNGSSWDIETVDSTDDVGQHASLALDSSGNPRIAYYDATHGWLKYASWNGSSWDIEAADTTGNVGQYASLEITSSGHPCIAYYESVDATHGKLRYAEKNGSWSMEVVDASVSNVGQYASLALDPAESHPLIANYDVTNGNLKYAEWNGSLWIVATIDGSSQNVGQFASLTVDETAGGTRGLMRVAYYNLSTQDLLYLQELP